MLLKKRNWNTYKSVIFLFLSFIIFGIIYYIFCEDYEFGGINILQEAVRNATLNKFVNEIETGEINDKIQNQINDEISRGNINDLLDEQISKKIKYKKSSHQIVKTNKYQKLFDRIYFATVTGTTLGYGDIYPLSNRVKCLTALQLLVTVCILFN